MKTCRLETNLMEIYGLLFKAYGASDWWPARTEYEIIIGAILTQNTAWKNVEKAIANLRRKRRLTQKGILGISEGDLAELIRPSGYYNQKAARLKNFADFLAREYRGSLKRLFALPIDQLRSTLLSLNGIGPETADSIILYAAGLPVFVIDAYTRRVFVRLGIIKEGLDYDELRLFFENNLPADAELFNEFHALIVRHAAGVCRKRPKCDGCILAARCAYRNESPGD